MLVYHEVPPDTLESILLNGLKRTASGEKSDDKAIARTDHFLDQHCPNNLRNAGVSRVNNIYAYLQANGTIVDIVDGRHIPIQEFITRSKQTILELDINPTQCYVSDLDTYDELKDALSNHKDQYLLDELAGSYWNKVKKLSEFSVDGIRRPEVLITYDVPARDIRKA
jgi:hypothetical protein